MARLLWGFHEGLLRDVPKNETASIQSENLLPMFFVPSYHCFFPQRMPLASLPIASTSPHGRKDDLRFLLGLSAGFGSNGRSVFFLSRRVCSEEKAAQVRYGREVSEP